MATGTIKRTRQGKGLSSHGALDMTRKIGNQLITFYDPDIVDKAMEKEVGILVAKKKKTKKGEKWERVLTSARHIHRKDLTSVFGKTHERAGEGKYIKQSALSPDSKIVRGVRNVFPYKTDEKSFYTTVQTFYSLFRKSDLDSMIGDLSDRWIRWRKKVIVSKLVSLTELWDIARNINPDLESILRESKSNVKGARHQSPLEKFFKNIEVMRRTRKTLHLSDGKVKYNSDATPYGLCLEQCGMCIDGLFLTSSIGPNGEEEGEMFYRLAIGRTIPQSLTKQEWKKLGPDNKIAYLSEKVRKMASKMARSIAA